MKHCDEHLYANLPASAADYIRLVVKKMGWKKKVRAEVRDELIGHFEDAVSHISDAVEKERKAKELIDSFGDAKVLAKLSRRAKKRCRPMWVKVWFGLCKVFGIIILYFVACSLPLFIGKPSINMDYLKMLNNNAQMGRDPNQNTKPIFDATAMLATKYPKELEKIPCWPGDLNNIEREALIGWLNKNNEAVIAFKKIPSNSNFWNTYNIEELKIDAARPLHLQLEKVLKYINTTLIQYRYLAYLIVENAVYDANNGDSSAAFDDCKKLLDLGSRLNGQGTLVEQIVGIGIDAAAIKTMYMILDRADVPLEILEKIGKDLTTVANPSISYTPEKVLFLDIIQHYFSDDGTGNGHMLVKGIPYTFTSFKDSITRLLTFNFPSKHETLASIESFYSRLEKTTSLTPYQLSLTMSVQENDLPLMLRSAEPSFYKVAEIAWRDKIYRSSLITTTVILRYKKEKGVFPDSLNQLVCEKYLKEVPQDPFSDKPLVYRKTENGFTLYSVGLNFKDGGGEVYRDDKGKAQIWSDKGDAVFWPVVK